jgi:hypothetical protein
MYKLHHFNTLTLQHLNTFTTFAEIMSMKEQVDTLLQQVKAGSISFKDVIEFIEAHYQHIPTAFKNGATYNEATQNQGSAKVFTFAQLNTLDKENTLALFAEHYQAVVNTSDGTDHPNIRQFMIHGWEGIVFDGKALVAKQ